MIIQSSSPSNGPKKSEEAGWINTDPQSAFWGDIHYYTYDADGWSPATYPDGPRFVSEYGIIFWREKHNYTNMLQNFSANCLHVSKYVLMKINSKT